MTILIPNKQKWLRRPGVPVEVNWNEPLAKDLLFYLPFIDGSLENLARDNSGVTAITGSTILNRDLDGLYIPLDAAAYVAPSASFPHDTASGDEYTIATELIMDSVSGSYPRIVSNLTGYNSLIAVKTLTGNGLSVYDGDWRVSTSLVNVGKRHSVAGVFHTGSRIQELWNNGSQVLTWSGNNETLGQPALGSHESERASGTFSYFLISGRALNADELRELKDFPYHFLKKRRSYHLFASPTPEISPASRSVSSTWRISSELTQRSVSTSWLIHGTTAELSITAPWSVGPPRAHRSVGVSWLVHGAAVDRSVLASWKVGLVIAERSLLSTWYIPPSRSLAAPWSMAVSARSVECPWQIAEPVQRSLQSQWSSTAKATRAVASPWNVLNYNPASRSIRANWQIIGYRPPLVFDEDFKFEKL